jgi:hypothetical protein
MLEVDATLYKKYDIERENDVIQNAKKIKK